MLLARLRSELENVCNFYHLINVLFSIAFPLAKMVPAISGALFPADAIGFDAREREILIFLVVIIVWKSRKSTNSLHALSTVYMFSKLANAVLFYRARPLFGVLYASLVLLFYVVVPEPLPPESNKIHYFQGEELRRTLERDKSVVWIIEFFATWSPECRYVAPVFSALSDRFSLPNLRFGKLDVGKYAREGDHFRVSSNAMGRQLPTIACFRAGVQTERRPLVGQNRRAIPFVFTKENIILALDLASVYAECKSKGGGGMKEQQRGKEE